MKFRNYYDRFLYRERNALITSDFSLILRLIFKFVVFLISLPFYLLGILFYFFIDSNKSKEYLGLIVSKPFEIMFDIVNWFFEAKYTSGLILFLVIAFIFEFAVLTSVGISNFLFSPDDFLKGNYYSIFTSVFLHADIVHLIGNLVGILVFGRIVEKQFNNKILLIFIISAFIANLISGTIYYLLGDLTPSLGASGGVAGLIIFAILLEPLTLTTILIMPLPIFVIGYALITIDILGFIGNSQTTTNHLAHIGGYLALLFMFFFLEFRNRKKLVLGLTINLLMILLIYLIVKIVGFERILSIGFF